jgi:hypothetical protein
MGTRILRQLDSTRLMQVEMVCQYQGVMAVDGKEGDMCSREVMVMQNAPLYLTKILLQLLKMEGGIVISSLPHWSQWHSCSPHKQGDLQ